MKQRITNWVLGHIVRVIVPSDVIRELKGILYLGNLPMSDDEVRSLQAEAKALESMRLWSIINESIKELSYEKGWRDSTTIEQLNTAKTQYHVLVTQNSIVNIIKNKKLS